MIIATRNRAAALRETLRAIPPHAEVIIVDNASTDLTPAAVRDARPDAILLRQDRNLGPTAKQLALERASHDLVIALDDDCAPTAPSTWDAMLRRFDAAPSLACAGFGVRLPTGAWECGALPRVFVGAAVAFRRDALLDAGGYDRRLFMQAEEYDIVYRLAARGWTCDVFHDIVAIHRKHATGRRPARTIFLDARNNIQQAASYIPAPWRSLYLSAWTQRYLALGGAARARASALRGVVAGRARALLHPAHPLPGAVFDDLFCRERVDPSLRALKLAGAERVLFATLGKNIPMYAETARRVGLRVVAIADDRFAHAGVRWRAGIPVLTDTQAASEDFDAVIVSNSAPIFAHQAAERWRRLTTRAALAPDALDADALASDARSAA